MINKGSRLATLFCASALLSAAGQASAAADDMPLGQLASPPTGYIDMCERTPALCVQNPNASPSQLQAVRQWAGQTRWSVIFARTLGVQNADVVSRQGATAATEPARDAALPPQPVRLVQPSVAPVPTPTPASGSAPVRDGARPVATRPWDLTRATETASRPEPVQPAAPAPAGPAPTRTSGAADAKDGVPTAASEAWQPPRFFADLSMDRLNEINRAVNRAIRPTSDLAAFGKVEYWTIPQGSRASGDCEDYVLAKRQALIEAGAPAESLSIAVVQTTRREMHTVLLVATADGEVVLDNLSPWIVSWRAAPYTWLQRQARGSALTWVYPGLPA